jgi:hypothetical protein
MPPRSRSKTKRYKPPSIVGDVDAIPPVKRANRGESVYDPIIKYAVENGGRWVAVDPQGRSLQAFRNAIRLRLTRLGLDMLVKQRGEYIYVKYEGDTDGMIEHIEKMREQTMTGVVDESA